MDSCKRLMIHFSFSIGRISGRVRLPVFRHLFEGVKKESSPMGLFRPLLAVFLLLIAGPVFGQRVWPAPTGIWSNTAQQASAGAQIPEATLARLPKPQALILDLIDESQLTTLRG
jgi:hypothetical protein